MTVTRTIRTARSVALVGASADPTKPAGRVLGYLTTYRYPGDIYLVNPNYAELAGHPCYPDLHSLPVPPNVVVIALSGRQTVPAVTQCVELGVAVVVVFASGFAELGTAAGQQLQQQLAAAVEGSTTRLIGPNTNGLVEVASGLPLTFMTALDDGLPLTNDGVGLVSQSGALGAFVLRQGQRGGLGVSSFYATGNEADLSLPELVTDLIEDGLRAVLLYIEGIPDGQAFQRALATARERGTPVAVLKVGVSADGAAAATSHTGALANDDVVLTGVLRRYQVPRARSIDHLLDLGKILALAPPPAGNRVSVLTLSGGAGILAADALGEHGLVLASWSGADRDRLAETLPEFASVNNPIDLTGTLVYRPELLDGVLQAALQHDGTDVVLVLLGNMQGHEARLCTLIADRAARSSKAIAVAWVGGTGQAPTRLAERGIPAFSDPVRAVEALGGLVTWHGVPSSARSDGQRRPTLPEHPGDDAHRKIFDEVEAKRIFASYGLPCAVEFRCGTPDEAAAAAGRLRAPYVVKGLSEALAHKSDHGLVALRLQSTAEVADATASILDTMRSLDVPGEVVVQEFVPTGAELILGMRTDPAFGPTVIIGTGGVLVEVLADVSARPAPVAATEALQMLEELQLGALLDGPRGTVPADRSGIAAAIAAFSRCVLDHPEWESAEINPLTVRSDDGSPIAVDALVVTTMHR